MLSLVGEQKSCRSNGAVAEEPNDCLTSTWIHIALQGTNRREFIALRLKLVLRSLSINVCEHDFSGWEAGVFVGKNVFWGFALLALNGVVSGAARSGRVDLLCSTR